MNIIDEQDISAIIEVIQPKIKKSLFQTSIENREDLEQELMVYSLHIMNNKISRSVPGFFSFFGQSINITENELISFEGY